MTISSSRTLRPRPTSSDVLSTIARTCARVWSSVPEASIPITRSARSCAAKPTIMPAWVEPATTHTTM